MRRLWLAVAVLAAVRVAVPLAQLAHADLPGLPPVRSHALSGDATGFYAGAREFIAAWGRIPHAVLALLAVATLAGGAALVHSWRRRPRWRPWLLLGAVWWVGLLLAVDAAEQRFSGAAVIGWSIVWGLPMLPVRVVGATLDQNVAFWLGLPLQLACNAVTVAATAYAGLYATGRRAVGVVAAALWAFWPFLTNVLAGHSAWANGTWAINAGLHMYTEPLSTALVAVVLALLLGPKLTPLRLTVAGAALGYATAVKFSNGLVAAAALVLLAWRFRAELRRVVPYVLGGLAFMPLVLTYWPIGYARLREQPGYWHAHVFSLRYVVRSWTDSLLFTPHTLAIIVPIAVVGIFALGRGWPVALLSVWTLANPVFYSFFWYTPVHPRFMWASLPAFFVLWAAGAVLLVRLAARAASARSAPTAAPRRP